MHARNVRVDARPGSHSSQTPLPMLLAVLATAICPGFAGGGATSACCMPGGAPAGTLVSDNQYTPPGDGKTHEDYDLPQNQWERAYREGLRQGYETGRQFPDQLDQAYRQGLRDGYQAQQEENDINTRTQKLLRTRDEALQTGLQAFNQGSYDRAADAFLLATEMDHGDPACRLYAAQSLFALQQYDQAVPLLRRAFDLQPNLLHLRFDLRSDYGIPADFASQVTTLQTFMSNNPDWSGGYLLLGYELLHSGQRDLAYQAFAHAVQIDPFDALGREFLRASFPLPTNTTPKASPASPSLPAPKAAPAAPAAPARRLAPALPAVPATPAAKVTATLGRKA